MRRDQSIGEISDGHFYTAKDMVKIGTGGCRGCSECCELGPVIVLDPYDIWQLQSGVGLRFEEILDQTVELTVIDGVVLPILKLIGADEETPGVCPYLDEMGRCSIHEFRPGICRLYPLGRYWQEDDFRYILQVGECLRSNGSKVKIRSWIGILGLERYEEFCRQWHALLTKIRNVGDREGADSPVVRASCLTLLQTFYFEPWDAEQEFYPQFEERLVRCRHALGWA